MTAMIETASIHVPKTAGTSFTDVLRRWYGADLSLYYECNGTIDDIGPTTRVVHGHMQAGVHEARHHVTWLRDPARRVISHYFYWRITQPVVKVDPLHLQVLDGSVSLLQFAEHPEIRNLAAWYFNGLDVDDFSFVGVVENGLQEMGRLAWILGMPATQSPRTNVTVSTEYEAYRGGGTMQRDIDAIRSFNDLDYELYAKAKDRMNTWWRAFLAAG